MSEISYNTFIFSNGDVYEGEYIIDDKLGIIRHGRGVSKIKSGIIYDGEFSNDVFNGYGIVKFSSGAQYEGEFLNNMFHGEGKYIFPDGSYYEGSFDNNRLLGNGKYVDTNKETWVGVFDNVCANNLKFHLTNIDTSKIVIEKK